MSSKKIIDMRSRPAFLHDFFGATPGTQAFETAKWLNKRLGSKDIEHFKRSYTVEGFLAEIEEAGIDKAVVVGRDTPAIYIGNDTIYDLVKPHQSLVGIGSVDPQKNSKAALLEVERAVKTLGLKGINLEPAFGATPIKADDATLFPIYDACDQLGVPVFLMSGPTSPALEYTDPTPLANVAKAFPKLPIVCYHGFYPFVNEVIGIAFRYDNIYLVPDMYLFMPGGKLYVEAANGFLRDQFLFGTSYPFRAMQQTVEDFLQVGFNDDVLDGVLYDNAARLLKL